MATTSAKTDSFSFAPVSAAEYAKHNTDRKTDSRLASKRQDIANYRATAAEYAKKVEASRLMASSLRGFIIAMEDNEVLKGLSFENLTSALRYYVSEGEYALQFVDEYTRKADRLEKELDGGTPVSEDRDI